MDFEKIIEHLQSVQDATGLKLLGEYLASHDDQFLLWGLQETLPAFAQIVVISMNGLCQVQFMKEAPDILQRVFCRILPLKQQVKVYFAVDENRMGYLKFAYWADLSLEHPVSEGFRFQLIKGIIDGNDDAETYVLKQPPDSDPQMHSLDMQAWWDFTLSCFEVDERWGAVPAVSDDDSGPEDATDASFMSATE